MATTTVEIPDGDGELVLRLQAIGRKAYDALIAQHPGEAGETYNPDTFAPALIAACCIEPDLSDEDARFLFDEWSAGEVAEVFAAAVAVNTRTARRGP